MHSHVLYIYIHIYIYILYPWHHRMLLPKNTLSSFSVRFLGSFCLKRRWKVTTFPVIESLRFSHVITIPIPSIYGIFTYIWLIFIVHVARLWFCTFFLPSPLPEEMIQFHEHIFQMGWNHQLECSVVTHIFAFGGLSCFFFWGGEGKRDLKMERRLT